MLSLVLQECINAKAMICSSVSLSEQYSFYINDKEIKIVQSIKYLGLVIKLNRSMIPAISTLTNQAKKLFVLMKKIVYLEFPPPFLMCKLFDALITPILEYSCQLWDFQAGNNKEIEILHRKFILRVPSSATNVGIYGELGRKPMQIRRSLLVIKYWFRLSQHIAHQCFTIHQQLNSAWLKHIQRLLNHSGFSYDKVYTLDPAEVIAEVKERLNDQYLQKWREEVSKSSKMRSYRR